jgi:GNAT superfamily N-acetyltransferase
VEYDSSRAGTESGGAVAVETVIGPGLSLDAVRELMAEYGRHPGIEPCIVGFDAELAGLPGSYAAPGGTLLLARLGGRPVGCVAVRRLDAGRCEMKRLYVRPAFRAAGIGILLAQEAIGWARRAGYRVILLDTLPAMRAARTVYELLGFRPCAPFLAEPTPGADCYSLDL